MQQTYLNETGVSLAMAVYLVTDHYDYVPGVISATGLMKALRPTILTPRVPPEMRRRDIVNLVKSRMGTSIHDGLEKAWTNPETLKRALAALGYPEAIFDRIVVNPTEPLAPDAIPVYMERRSFREVLGRTISGKFDFVAEGAVRDLKTTSTFTWSKGMKTDDYILQQSIYRWLNPDIITSDTGAVEFIFTDWKAGFGANTANYPSAPVKTLYFPLLSLEETQDWIEAKLRQHDQFQVAHEQDLPDCDDKELWRKAPAYKYYASGVVGPRSTKNFDTSAEAYAELAAKNKGIVVEVPGEVVACKYCDAFPICTQKDRYIADGSLKL